MINFEVEWLDYYVIEKCLCVLFFNKMDGGYDFCVNEFYEILFVGIYYLNEEGGVLNVVFIG